MGQLEICPGSPEKRETTQLRLCHVRFRRFDFDLSISGT
jgi:hypothetical protein